MDKWLKNIPAQEQWSDDNSHNIAQGKDKNKVELAATSAGHLVNWLAKSSSENEYNLIGSDKMSAPQRRKSSGTLFEICIYTHCFQQQTYSKSVVCFGYIRCT